MKRNWKKNLLITAAVLISAFAGFCLFSYLVIPRGASHYTEEQIKAMHEILPGEENLTMQERLKRRGQ
jgi:hypothetical protein